jgi:hypothetical protein
MSKVFRDLCSPTIDIENKCNDPDVGDLYKDYYLPVLTAAKPNWRVLRGEELCHECRRADFALGLLRLTRLAVCGTKGVRGIRDISELSTEERARYAEYCTQVCAEVRTMDATNPPGWLRALYGEVHDGDRN